MRLIAVVLLIVLARCETVVEVDVPFEAPTMTLNSVLNPDSAFHVRLTLNRHILDDGLFQPVLGATVQVYEDEQLVTTLTGENGNYRSLYRPISGKNYRVEATSPEYGKVSSWCFIPTPIALENVIVTERMIDGDVRTYLQLQFDDPSGETNYYELVVYGTREYYDPPRNLVFTNTGQLTLEHVSGLTAFDEGLVTSALRFSDEHFDGKKMNLVVRSFGALESWSELRIVLRSVSDEYYKYQSTLALQRSTADNPFAQPVNVFSNIQGGFGIFTGYGISADSRVMPPPAIHSIEPMEGSPGEVITIKGENLPRGTGFQTGVNFRAWYGISRGRIVEYSPSVIKVEIPLNAVTGKIFVHSNGRIIISEADFAIKN